MSLRARLPVVPLVAALVLWHGLLQAVPHNHAEAGVPQEHLACRASHPLSQESHLHGAGEAMTPHPCLACLVGSTAASVPGLSRLDGLAPGLRGLESAGNPARSLIRTQLPPSRGPPQVA